MPTSSKESRLRACCPFRWWRWTA